MFIITDKAKLVGEEVKAKAEGLFPRRVAPFFFFVLKLKYRRKLPADLQTTAEASKYVKILT